MALRSGDGIPDVLVVDHDPSSRARCSRSSRDASARTSSLAPPTTKVERVNGGLGDKLRAFANGRKDDWDVWLPYTVFAINNAASTLGCELTPFFID